MPPVYVAENVGSRSSCSSKTLSSNDSDGIRSIKKNPILVVGAQDTGIGETSAKSKENFAVVPSVIVTAAHPASTQNDVTSAKEM